MLISSRTTDGLQQTALVSQESLSVGVEDGHQTHLGNIEALTKEVDADDDIDVAEAERIDDLGSLDGIDFRVQVVRFDAHAVEVGRHLFSEFDRHHGDQGTLPALDSQVDLREQIVDLAGGWTDLNFGIEQPGGTQLHFSDALDAVQHVVHRFRLGVLFRQIGLTCTATAR